MMMLISTSCVHRRASSGLFTMHIVLQTVTVYQLLHAHTTTQIHLPVRSASAATNLVDCMRSNSHGHKYVELRNNVIFSLHSTKGIWNFDSSKHWWFVAQEGRRTILPVQYVPRHRQTSCDGIGGGALLCSLPSFFSDLRHDRPIPPVSWFYVKTHQSCFAHRRLDY